MPQGDVQKWKTAFQHYKQWDSESARKVQEKEAKVIIEWLKDLKRPRYDILEIGCGNGYVGKLIITELLKENIPLSYTFTDLIPECLEVAKENVNELQSKAEINFKVLDAYEADKVLGENSQDIIISTGYASAATQSNAIPAISKVLKKDGVLIADFVNHLSPLLFISKFPHSLGRLIKVLRKDRGEKLYYFGFVGLDEHFLKYKLRKVAKKTIRLRRNPFLCMFRKIT